MKKPRTVAWINRQRVLLAIYALAEGDGLRCYAPWTRIAADAGVLPETAKWHVERLDFEGLVRIVPEIKGKRRRTIVLMDHPDARTYYAWLTQAFEAKHPSPSRHREADEAKRGKSEGSKGAPPAYRGVDPGPAAGAGGGDRR